VSNTTGTVARGPGGRRAVGSAVCSMTMASARWIALGARLLASGAVRGLSAAPAACYGSRLARPVVGAGTLRLLLRPPARAVCCSAGPPQAESSPADAKLQELNQQVR